MERKLPNNVAMSTLKRHKVCSYNNVAMSTLKRHKVCSYVVHLFSIRPNMQSETEYNIIHVIDTDIFSILILFSQYAYRLPLCKQ
ncbi:Hypothetical predicted protein [Octopus vulgaris]|uniref:Uncharacterized protein n=1 Tax=Octopus vulgaris TaxID=6645 RepID=A0AA36F9T3_OCTVU|nr:Hypothetical predicted protein [Octopus vulgaris]